MNRINTIQQTVYQQNINRINNTNTINKSTPTSFINSDKPIILDSKAAFSWADTSGNIAVYRDEAYTKENPYMLVKGVDADGSSFETQINPEKVNPSNASKAEMAALTAYMLENNELKSFNSAIIKDKTKPDGYLDDSFFEKHNYMASIQSFADMQLANKNMDGYSMLFTIRNSLAKYPKQAI